MRFKIILWESPDLLWCWAIREHDAQSVNLAAAGTYTSSSEAFGAALVRLGALRKEHSL